MRRALQDVRSEDDRVRLNLTMGELATLFEPTAYQGMTFIDLIIGSLQVRAANADE